MKLSNEQIDVLVDEIYDKTKKSSDSKKEKALKAKIKAETEHTWKVIQQLPKHIRNIVVCNDTKKSIAEELTLHYQEDNDNEWVVKRDIRKKVVLASIDATTIEELAKRFKVTL